MDVLESITNVFKSLVDDEPKPPLHVGEVMSLWTYLVGLRDAAVMEQSCVNMTTSPDLIETLKEAIHLCTAQADKLEKFLIKEGVPLPPVSSTKPNTNPADVPSGAKLTNDEIANAVSIKTASAIVACATAQTQSLRSDVGLMWLKFQMEHVTFAGSLKSLMRLHGWIKTPPYYTAPGIPTQESPNRL